MYVRVYACVRMCVFVCVRACVQLCVNCVCVCVWVSMRVCVNVSLFVFVSICQTFYQHNWQDSLFFPRELPVTAPRPSDALWRGLGLALRDIFHKISQLCCCVACGCGVSPMSAAALPPNSAFPPVLCYPAACRSFSRNRCQRSWRLSCDFAHTMNETLKWLTQLPTLMQNHSGGDSVASRC